MVSQTEVAVVKANGRSAASKTRSKGASNSTRSGTKSTPSKRAPKAPTGTDIVPVMKLKAIDIVDEQGSGNKAIARPSDDREAEIPTVLHMPPPMDGGDTGETEAGSLVTDPELLELLQQLSETIDTANTVLDVAASEVESNSAMPHHNGADTGHEDSGSFDEPGPSDANEDEDDDQPSIAAQQAARHAAMGQQRPQRKFGFGLVGNAALAGLILAAGAAWILHTNPWIMNELRGGIERAAISAAALPEKIQIATQAQPGQERAVDARLATVKPSPVPASADAAGRQQPREIVTAALGPANSVPDPVKPGPAGQENLNSLDMISSPVFARPGEAAVLDIAIDTGPGSLETSIMVQGLPDSIRLSSGKDLGSGNWLVKTDELSGLQMLVGETALAGTYGAEFIAVKNDGSVPETQDVKIIIAGTPPAASKPDAARQTAVARQAPGTQSAQSPAAKPDAIPAPLTEAEAKALLARGNALLTEGDVSGARLLLEYVAQRGSKDAMVMLAQSYDPKHLSKLPILGVQPNAEVAAQWYERAALAGQ